MKKKRYIWFGVGTLLTLSILLSLFYFFDVNFPKRKIAQVEPDLTVGVKNLVLCKESLSELNDALNSNSIEVPGGVGRVSVIHKPFKVSALSIGDVNLRDLRYGTGTDIKHSICIGLTAE